MFDNGVGTEIYGEDEASEEQRAAQYVPHDPHLGPICRTYGQQEFSVYKFVPPPPSSFFQTICTKDLDKGAQSDATVTSQNVSTRKQTLVAAKECVCALNENISFVSFFDQRKERFEGNIYNTPSLKPLMSKKLPLFKSYPSKTNPLNVK